jgi:hypothetical protein
MTGYDARLILHGKKRGFFCPKNIESRKNDTLYPITNAFGSETILTGKEGEHGNLLENQ